MLLRTRLSLVAAAVAAATLFAAPVHAGTAEETPGDVSFAMFDPGDAVFSDGAEFGLGDLQQYGIGQAVVEQLGRGETVTPEPDNVELGPPVEPPVDEPVEFAAPAATVLAPAAADPRYSIAGEWKDKWNTPLVIRNGWWSGADAGFGLTKVTGKHNLTLRAVRATTKYPRPVGGKTHISGSKYEYRTDVLHVECSGVWIFKRCKVTDRKTILVAADFRQITDGKPFGVVTAYCEGVSGKCPDWVKNSINI